MIQTIVSNANAPEYGQATISFPIREEDYPSVVNMLQRMDLGDPLERDCRVDEVCGDWPILKRLEKVAINLDEMDYLAKRLDSFDAQEKAKFQAAAVRFGLFDMRHLIDLTFCCQETTVITDFSDLEKVGRRHYLDVNGSSAPSEELENVDGYETALLLIGDGDGTITPYGVIYDNGMQLRSAYDGQNFPLYQYQDAVLVLGLTHESDLDMNSATTWLFLPASAERLERAFKRGGFEPGSSIHCTCVGGNIQEELEARLDFERESLKDLNTLVFVELADERTIVVREQKSSIAAAQCHPEPNMETLVHFDLIQVLSFKIRWVTIKECSRSLLVLDQSNGILILDHDIFQALCRRFEKIQEIEEPQCF